MGRVTLLQSLIVVMVSFRGPTSWGETPTARAVARPLHQLLDERLRDFRSDAQPTVRERSAVAQGRFELVQRRQILALPEEADRDDLTPLAALLHGGLEVGRVV